MLKNQKLICQECKKEFVGRRNPKYCSRKCYKSFYEKTHPYYYKDYQLKNKERYDQIKKRWRENNKEKCNLSQYKYEKKHPEKKKARSRSYLKKDTHCFICGIKEKLEFHHSDYEKDIGITLCFKHHRDIHKLLKGGLRKWVKV